jgi:hydroxymethylglutaryl-CoA reductase
MRQADEPMSVGDRSSRLPGFYREPVASRVERLVREDTLGEATVGYLRRGGGLAVDVADRMSENVLAVHGLPLSVALNFRVNGRDVLVPMAIEEPSVVAAASHAALLARTRGGFRGEATAPVMTTQIQLDEVPDAEHAPARIGATREALAELANAAIPRMVARGGGFRGHEVRVLDAPSGLVCVHLYIDVGDAMGANVVDAVAEAVAPWLHETLGGCVGLRILSNLPVHRMVTVTAEVGDEELSGLSDGIVRASRFAEHDPYRAVTHNKGILNGIDAAAVALGQDWRAIEAGAHGWAALGDPSRPYRPLATWHRTGDGVRGHLEMPLAVGTVGGATEAHDGIRAAFDLVQTRSARELAVVLASAGLACNLAALRALVGEGIQREHMRLHARKPEVERRTSSFPKVEPGTSTS